jgi:hypothetical protein
MPRNIKVTIPKAETETILAEVRQVDGLVGLSIQRDGSLEPPGDIISLDVVNNALNPVMKLLDRYKIGQRSGTSVSTSEPTSIVSTSFSEELTRDTNEAIWEEMEITAGNESNMTMNMLTMMMLSGIISAIGILTNSIHVVIGGMIISPGFVPIARVALGTITKSGALRRGLKDTFKGYLALIVGAASTMLVYRLMTELGINGMASYLEAGELTSYWTSISYSSIAVSAAAAIAGGLLIAPNRSILTGGVMIALALIPSAALAAMALVVGEFGLSQKAFLRWLIDVGLVFVMSYGVFAWKRNKVYKREMIL